MMAPAFRAYFWVLFITVATLKNVECWLTLLYKIAARDFSLDVAHRLDRTMPASRWVRSLLNLFTVRTLYWTTTVNFARKFVVWIHFPNRFQLVFVGFIFFFWFCIKIKGKFNKCTGYWTYLWQLFADWTMHDQCFWALTRTIDPFSCWPYHTHRHEPSHQY